MISRRHFLFGVGIIPLLLSPSRIQAQDRFLTLPFRDQSVQIQQAWYYTPGGTLHKPLGAVDFVKGKTDDSATWESFEVIAAADGVAMQSVEQGYGTMVLVRHNQTDSTGQNYFTLYAHLDPNKVDPSLPFFERHSSNYQQWKPVKAGDVLASAGSSGFTECSSANCIMLHFEVMRGAYYQNQTDPYDLRDIRDSYPGFPAFTACGINYLWTTCPPVSSPIEPFIFSNIGADGTYQSGLRFTFGYEAFLNRTVSVAFPFTPTGNYRLSRLELGIVAVNQGGTVKVELRTDLNGLPGNILESWLTDMPQSGTLASPRVALSSVSNPALALGQQYWLVATAAPGAGTGQWYTVSNDPSNFLRSINGGPWSGVQSPRGAMRLYGVGGSP